MLAAILLALLRYAVPIVLPDAMLFGVFAGFGGVLLILLWWLFFSRVRWSERVGAVLLIVAGLLVTSRLVHVSIANGGMGILFYFLAIPVLSLVLVAWAVATRHLTGAPRFVSLVATIVLACGAFTLLRTGGVRGYGGSDLHWRWTPTPEQKLLATTVDQPKALPSAPAPPKTAADWPGFRGAGRNSIVSGVRIETNWSASPPIELWRRPVGPGWSSFAVRDALLYTQEQRGEEEVVACYNLATGEPVWRHADATRFWESNAGAGPRATPTLSHGRVYAFGATGILNTLDATNGAVVWSRNLASDSEMKVPMWGFASSPLVTDDLVLVAASGRLVACDLASGKPRWFGPAHTGSYSSPQLATIDGVAQILQLSGAGLASFALTNGAQLWEHAWSGCTIIQPALTPDGEVLLSTATASGGIGLRRLAVTNKPGGWSVEERWTSKGLKPYFNDFVIHKGHAFGFDGSILACVDLADGKRAWKGGRYGNGQLLLLPEQDLLLVLSEEGELALVGATPGDFTELARFPAIKGKTWNHPVLVGDVLLVRNSQEMAAFRLPLPHG